MNSTGNVIRGNMFLLSLLLPTVCSVVCLAQAEDKEYVEAKGAHEARIRSFEFGESLLRDRPSDDFVSIPYEALSDEVKSCMYNGFAAVLQEGARPQRLEGWRDAGRATVRVYAAKDRREDDLVEFCWDYLGQNLRAVSSRNALQIEINIDEALRNPKLRGGEGSEVGRVRAFVERAIRLKGETFSEKPQEFSVEIPWPAQLSEGTQFSTNPEQNILQVSSLHWYKRVDFAVRDRVLRLLFYFKPEQLAFPVGNSSWFPEEFRADVTRRAEEKSKEPDSPNTPPR